MSAGPVAVTLIAEFTALAGRAALVESELLDYARLVRAESGCVRFDAYRRRDSADRFVVYEVYRDQAAFDVHLAAPYGAAFNGKLEALIVEERSELTFLTPVG